MATKAFDLKYNTRPGSVTISAPGISITGATAATPVVITAVAHGLSNDDVILITGILGMIELNDRAFTVKNVAADTFEIQNEDGVDENGAAHTAYSSGGVSTSRLEVIITAATQDNPVKLTTSVPSILASNNEVIVRGVVGMTEINDRLFSIGVTSSTQFNLTGEDGTGHTAYSSGGTATRNLEATITAATAENPVEISASLHGYLNGEIVTISGVVGMTELNGRTFEVANKFANEFDLLGEDGSAHTAYVSGGSVASAGGISSDVRVTYDDTVIKPELVDALQVAKETLTEKLET